MDQWPNNTKKASVRAGSPTNTSVQCPVQSHTTSSKLSTATTLKQHTKKNPAGTLLLQLLLLPDAPAAAGKRFLI